MKRFIPFILMLLAGPLAHAATITQAQLDARGTIQLSADTYAVSFPLSVHSNTTIIGAPGFASHVILNGAPYALVFDANASNITITGVDVHCAAAFIGATAGQYTGLHITDNQIQTGRTNGNNGIDITRPNADTLITYNYFHDSPQTNRNWLVQSAGNSHLDYNLFYNINDGGHLIDATNSTCSWNYGTLIRRMGQEVQSSAAGLPNQTNVICDHDVFFDYLGPYWDSEGISFCPASATKSGVTNCYIKTSLAPGSHISQPDSGGIFRFGYLNEGMAPSMIFSGNTLVIAEKSFAGFGAGMVTLADHNTVFGGSNAMYGVFGGDVGPGGKAGSWQIGDGNVIHSDLATAPTPPPNTFAGPQFAGGHVPPVIVIPPVIVNNPIPKGVPAISVKAVATDTGVVLTLTQPLTDITVETSTPSDKCGSVTLASGSTIALANLNPGWQYISLVRGTLDGVAVSGSATYSTSGKSPDDTKAKPATLAVPAPTVQSVETIVIQHMSDGTSKHVSDVIVPQ